MRITHDGSSAADGPSASSTLAAAVDTIGIPVLAAGVELIGESQGSGYREAPSLVRRADGQTLQLTRLLYLILESVDGRRDLAEIADRASSVSGRLVSPENVRTLIDSQLLPLGLLQLADGSQPEVRKADPLLGMRFRYSITDPERTRRLTAPFAVLFNPLIVAAVTVAFVATCWWVLMVKGLASATHDAFANPGLVLLILLATVLSAGFHEFGHAAAARRGGATPGAMGAGLYLIWPAFYTDVTDSYRLGRGGRIRTDLGGLYFNAIVAVATMGIWWASGYDALLLVIVTQILQMVRQLLPLVRFDGYHILADTTGVPDLFQRIKPTLLSLLPWRRNEPDAQVLKPWARAIVTLWVLVTVPLLLLSLVLMVLSMPRLLGTAWASIQEQYAMLNTSLGNGDVLDASVRVLAIAAVALPVLAVVYILLRLGRQLVTGLWRKTNGSALHRGTAVIAVAAVLAGLAWAWWPGGDTYRPVQPYERGTLADTSAAIFPAGASTGMIEGQAGSTVALWPEGVRTPTRDEPQLSMVLVPRQTDEPGNGGAAAPSWVFPFDRPAAPGEDGNQAFAVNTTDGSVAYDIAFALVWTEDGSDVRTRNEANAYASCADCTAVAVGFQVVLIVGQADVIVPENLSEAANYNCLRCLTYALADQLVLTLDEPLSPDGTAQLNELWKEIADFGRNLQRVPFSEIQGRLNTFKQQISNVIRTDPNARPVGPSAPATPPPTSPSPAATTGTTPAPGGSQAQSPGASRTPRPSGGSTADAPAPVPTGRLATPVPQPTPSKLKTAPAPGATPAPTYGEGQTLPEPTATVAPKA